MQKSSHYLFVFAITAASLLSFVTQGNLSGSPSRTEFNPNMTDVLGYTVTGFVSGESDTYEVDIGLAYALFYGLPMRVQHF